MLKIKLTRTFEKSNIKLFDGITLKECQKINSHWSEIMKIVHKKALEYINENTDESSFPIQSELTGNYYIDSVSYVKQVNPIGFQLTINLHFTELFNKMEEDYLGLGVILFTTSEINSFTILGIDSFSI